MAIYHFSAKMIARSNGRSAVAAAAYRSASGLLDERDARTHDFRHKADVVHSEILLPAGAPERWADRGKRAKSNRCRRASTDDARFHVRRDHGP